MDEPIKLSNDYRSGFMLRVKRVNGKVMSTWLELSDHNERLEATLKSLDSVLESMKLKSEINMSSPSSPNAPPEKLNVRYFCSKCGYSFPCFPSSPPNMSYYCPTCNKWGNFQKR